MGQRAIIVSMSYSWGEERSLTKYDLKNPPVYPKLGCDNSKRELMRYGQVLPRAVLLYDITYNSPTEKSV